MSYTSHESFSHSVFLFLNFVWFITLYDVFLDVEKGCNRIYSWALFQWFLLSLETSMSPLQFQTPESSVSEQEDKITLAQGWGVIWGVLGMWPLPWGAWQKPGCQSPGILLSALFLSTSLFVPKWSSWWLRIKSLPVPWTTWLGTRNNYSQSCLWVTGGEKSKAGQHVSWTPASLLWAAVMTHLSPSIILGLDQALHASLSWGLRCETDPGS